jgi:putative oxidoreductase
MPAALQNGVSLIARILMSVIFLLSGIHKLMDWSGTAEQMESKEMPAVQALLAAAVIVEIVCGLAILLGCQTRIASFFLFLYLIPTTLVFHNFWAYQGPDQQNQMFNFLKNLAIMGGLLEFTAFGAGSWSIDALMTRRPLAIPVTGRAARPV